jgi:hypothetical protein
MLQTTVYSHSNVMLNNLLGDSSVSVLHDFVNMLGCLDGVGLLVDLMKFFEGTALGLNTGK